MPRTLKTFYDRFAHEVNEAVGFVQDAEEMCLPTQDGSGFPYVRLNTRRIEYLYELAFLRMYMGWEVFLEDTVLRCLLGFHTKDGKPSLVGGLPFCKNLDEAKGRLFS